MGGGTAPEGAGGATILRMGEHQDRQRIAFVEAVLEVTQDLESVRKYLIEAASTLPAAAGALFPLGLGDELHRTGEERYINWVGYRSADPGPVQALLSTGTPDSIRCAAANPIAPDDWIDACMRRGENEAGACIAGLAPSRALDAIVRNPVCLTPLAFERLVSVAFCQGPNALARLRSLCLVENFETYVHNVLGEVDARIDSLRWYAEHASRDLHRWRSNVLVRDAAAWAEVLRNLPEQERCDAVRNLLPGGVIDYLRARRKDGEDLCGGLSERLLRQRGSWHNASWRGARPRRLTRRGVRRVMRSGEIAGAVASILQGHEVTEANLVRYPKLRELLDTAAWIESGTLGRVARQPALLPYALTAMRNTPERYTTYDFSAFWRSMHTHPLEVRVEAACAVPWSLRHADANHVEPSMLVATEGSTWIGEWLDQALCSPVAKKQGAWVHDKVCEAQVAHFAAWHLASRTRLLKHVRKEAPDTITTWERTSALLAGWALPAGKLVDVVVRLG